MYPYPVKLIIGAGPKKLFTFIKDMKLDKSTITNSSLPMSSLATLEDYQKFIQTKIESITFSNRTIGDIGEYNIRYFDWLLTLSHVQIKLIYIFDSETDKENMQKILTLSENHSNISIINKDLFRRPTIRENLREFITR